MFKTKRSYLVIAVLILMVMMIPLGLNAQSEELPPPPPIITPANEERGPDGKKPTATPNEEEAKSLPPRSTPTEQPKEVIDTAPDLDIRGKYAIVIQRGKSDLEVTVFVPLGTEPDKFLEKYLNPDDGDTYHLTNLTPRGSRPPTARN